MRLADLHTHILPGVDDGAARVEDSLALLRAEKEQGVTDVVLTPHFLPESSDIETSTERWRLAFEELSRAVRNEDLPALYGGCEVLYFEGMGKSSAVKQLCMGKSNYILIEFASMKIGDNVISDLTDLRYNIGVIPIIAHTERYFDFKGFKKLKKLFEDGICLAQLNASSLAGGAYKRAALKLIKEDLIYIVASDVHSLNYRPCELSEAFCVIKEHFGKSRVNRYISNSEKLLLNISGETE